MMDMVSFHLILGGYRCHWWLLFSEAYVIHVAPVSCEWSERSSNRQRVVFTYCKYVKRFSIWCRGTRTHFFFIENFTTICSGRRAAVPFRRFTRCKSFYSAHMQRCLMRGGVTFQKYGRGGTLCSGKTGCKMHVPPCFLLNRPMWCVNMLHVQHKSCEMYTKMLHIALISKDFLANIASFSISFWFRLWALDFCGFWRSDFWLETPLVFHARLVKMTNEAQQRVFVAQTKLCGDKAQLPVETPRGVLTKRPWKPPI